MVDREDLWSRVVYLVRRSKGRPVSPEGRWPLLFELDDQLSDLPTTLAQLGSVAPLGQQEKIATVMETVTHDHAGNRLKVPGQRPHAAIVQTSMYAFYPPRLKVED
jgi:hypothetical protein